MRTLTLITLLGLTIFFSSSFAQNTSTTPVPSAPSTSEAASPAPSSNDKSTLPETHLVDETSKALTDASKAVQTELKQTRLRRENADYFILGSYSPLDLIVPSKYGASIGLIRSADVTWEFEYLRGSVSVPFLVEDLGKMTDERFSIIRRSYLGSNSFNLSYGITYFDFSLHLGSDLLNRLSGNSYPSVDLVNLESFGFNIAFGNRWSLKHNITVGLDWISWYQPVIVTKKDDEFLTYADNPNDRDDVETAIDIISYFPRFSFLKLQVGILF